jgi:serine acetyltransferase
MLVAPLIVGAGARTGAGSVVTKDVEPGATVVGVPARQITRVNPLGSAGPEQPPEGKERRR